jgi:hypothetical protein
MDIQLNYEQRARLELISLHAGKSAARVLLEAAEFLLTLDPECLKQPPADEEQAFLSNEQLEARFARILRR